MSEDTFRASVHIRKVATGEVRVFECEEPVDESGDSGDAKWSNFMWSEGNFSCDCNRELFFCRVAGEKADEQCGNSRFMIDRIVRDSDGKILYSESGEETQ